MKRLSLKSLTFVLALSMVTILLALRQNVLAREKSAPRILLAAILISQVLERLFLPLSSSPRGSRMVAKDSIFVLPTNATRCIHLGKNKR